MGTSPSCLTLNDAGTRLYSSNETDRVGEGREGTVSAFAVDRADGQIRLLCTVPSGGAGPTYVSVHPSRRIGRGGTILAASTSTSPGGSSTSAISEPTTWSHSVWTAPQAA
jgi:6-phosphogluconolactonase